MSTLRVWLGWDSPVWQVIACRLPRLEWLLPLTAPEVNGPFSPRPRIASSGSCSFAALGPVP